MRKSIAALLSAAMILSFFVGLVTFSVTATADSVMNETMATEVYITTAQDASGSNSATGAADYADAVLQSGDSKTYGSGTASFEDGVLTLENVSGIAKIEAFDGSLIVDVKGVNTLENEMGRSLFVHDSATKCADLTITSSTGGTLNSTALQYNILSRYGNILVDGDVVLNVHSTGATGNNPAIQITNQTDISNSSITFAGNAKVTVDCVSTSVAKDGNGVFGNGVVDVQTPDSKLIVKDNAQLSATNQCAGHALYATGGIEILGNANVVASASMTTGGYGCVASKGTIKVAGNSVLTASSFRRVIRSGEAIIVCENGTMNSSSESGWCLTTDLDASVTVSDAAVLKATATKNSCIVMNRNNTSGTGTFNVTGGKVELTSTATTSNSGNGIITTPAVNISGGLVKIKVNGTGKASNLSADKFNVTGEYWKTADDMNAVTEWYYIGKSAVAGDASDTVVKNAEGKSLNGFELAGVQIRLNDAKRGLRFVARVSDALLDALAEAGATNVEYGMLVARQDLMSGALTMPASSGSVSAGGVGIVPGTNTFETDDGYKYYTAVLTGIPDSFLQTNIVGLPYLTFTIGGTTQTIYAYETETSSFATVQDGCYGVSLYTVTKYLVDNNLLDAADAAWAQSAILDKVSE